MDEDESNSNGQRSRSRDVETQRIRRSNMSADDRERTNADRRDSVTSEQRDAINSRHRQSYSQLDSTQLDEINSTRRQSYNQSDDRQSLNSDRRDVYNSQIDEQLTQLNLNRRNSYNQSDDRQAHNSDRRDLYNSQSDAQLSQLNANRRTQHNSLSEEDKATRNAARNAARKYKEDFEKAQLGEFGKTGYRSARDRSAFMFEGRTFMKRFVIGERNQKCSECNALFFNETPNVKHRQPRNVSFGKCCNHGKIKVDIPACPPLLQQLFSGQHPLSKNFQSHLRQYNSALSMACVGYKRIDMKGPGTYCFKVHGEIKYMLYNIGPNITSPSYNQTWILDTEEATKARMDKQCNTGCDSELMALLHETLLSVNPLCQKFRCVYERENNVGGPDYRIVFRHHEGQQFGQPVAAEIAALFGDNDTDDTERGIICHVKASTAQPMHQPMLTTTIVPSSDQNSQVNSPIANLNQSTVNLFKPSTSRENLPANPNVFRTTTNATHVPPIPITNTDTNGQGKNAMFQTKYFDGDHALCDPLSYPLLRPYGDAGWYIYRPIEPNSFDHITHIQYYRYLLAHRESVFNALHFAGKLTLQWIVDCWAKTEANRLKFMRFNQSLLRVETVANVQDFDEQFPDVENAPNVGKKTKLPSSHTGSPRDQLEKFYDAMAIVARYGKPDLFITFTCNPKWPEFAKWGSQTHLHVDDICEVFKIKAMEFIDDLDKKEIFGKVQAYVAVFEFQKRGLPHCHILLILHPDDKPRSSDDVDQMISAELPNKETEPELHEKVCAYMLHRKCGEGSPCWKNGKCSKGFPRQFSERTVISNRSYPVYKRSRNGVTASFGGRDDYDNSYVVPYNWQLLLKYDAHINVELCGTVGSIKYLYKYIYKGSDRASVDIVSKDKDEIAMHLNTRYLSATEAYWRIFEYPLNKRSHSVEKLVVHAPANETVRFLPGQHAAAAAAGRVTTLTGWFELNQRCARLIAEGNQILDSRQFLYLEIPEHFTWNGSRWQERVNNVRAIGRMYRAKPETDEYYLRMMLLHVRGAQGFDDLRRVEGNLYPTFKEAANAAGLIHDDGEYERCLDEAALMDMPAQIRSVFAIILATGSPQNPHYLYEKFGEAMREDFVRQGFSTHETVVFAYLDIKRITSGLGLADRDFDRMLPMPDNYEQFRDVPFSSVFQFATGLRNIDTLNTEQRLIFNAIVNAYEQKLGNRLFSIDGPAGSGKTYLYNAIYNYCVGKGAKVLCVAWSGIAASLLPNGRTLHNAFKLPVPIDSANPVSSMRAQTAEARKLAEYDIILLDEVSMASKYALMAADSLLRDLTKCPLPFGGKIVICGGDFRQVLPVVPRGTEGDIVNESVVSCPLWLLFDQLSLITNMRTVTSNDENHDHPNWLLRIGNGVEPSDQESFIKLPERFSVNSKEELINSIYSNFSNLEEKIILTTTNEDAFEVNDIVLDQQAGIAREFASSDSFVSETGQDTGEFARFMMEYINSLTPSGYPRHILRLKKNCIVTLLRNLDVERGLTNGTRLFVEDLGDRTRRHILLCRIAHGHFKGQQVLIPRIPIMGKATNLGLPCVLRRVQFPIRLSFASTINRAQGQTFTDVGIYLKNQIFSHGQCYVALSRVKDPSHLRVFPGGRIKNVVYKSVLVNSSNSGQHNMEE